MAGEVKADALSRGITKLPHSWYGTTGSSSGTPWTPRGPRGGITKPSSSSGPGRSRKSTVSYGLQRMGQTMYGFTPTHFAADVASETADKFMQLTHMLVAWGDYWDIASNLKFINAYIKNPIWTTLAANIDILNSTCYAPLHQSQYKRPWNPRSAQLTMPILTEQDEYFTNVKDKDRPCAKKYGFANLECKNSTPTKAGKAGTIDKAAEDGTAGDEHAPSSGHFTEFHITGNENGLQGQELTPQLFESIESR
ncbi:hypothetical protein GB937_010422 [Aspergillus fischeri]|nr:hypothetical protein GB937_010422 [Aspergillus fischeri]